MGSCSMRLKPLVSTSSLREIEILNFNRISSDASWE